MKQIVRDWLYMPLTCSCHPIKGDGHLCESRTPIHDDIMFLFFCLRPLKNVYSKVAIEMLALRTEPGATRYCTYHFFWRPVEEDKIMWCCWHFSWRLCNNWSGTSTCQHWFKQKVVPPRITTTCTTVNQIGQVTDQYGSLSAQVHPALRQGILNWKKQGWEQWRALLFLKMKISWSTFYYRKFSFDFCCVPRPTVLCRTS